MKLRKHLTYANVAATLALAGVIGGGGAYAAGMIGSGDIRDNSIRSKDLKNRAAVKARDVKRDGLTGREIREHTLRASEFVPMTGNRGSCNPAGSEFTDCAKTDIRLRRAGRLFIVATGDFFGGTGSSLDCRIEVNGSLEPGASFPGQVGDPSSMNATDGFARTGVTPPLQRGKHVVALRCAEDIGDGQLASASVAVLGISG